MDSSLRRKIEYFEQFIKKVINAKWSFVFNGVCLREGILPKYITHIYIYISFYFFMSWTINICN